MQRRGAEKQPEFFNIMLEKHKDDARGYDVIGFVDPVRRGNYGSRLSHSCAPNAVSVSMGVRGKYNIAVYASRDIGFGEELCFHYNSITEDEKEWRDAVCLCGTAACNGHFLIYAGTQLYTEVIRDHHHVLHRTAKLFDACCTSKNVTQRERALLQRHALKDSALGADTPVWLHKYAAAVCAYIEREQEALPLVLQAKAAAKHKGYAEFAEHAKAVEEVGGLRLTRLCNLATTLNKMALFLRQQRRQLQGVPGAVWDAPLFRRLSPAEVVSAVWLDRGGVIDDLVTLLRAYEGAEHPLVARIEAMRSRMQQREDITASRLQLLSVRDSLLRLAPRAAAYHHAASDVVLMYAMTRHWFVFAPAYRAFASREFSFKQLGYDRAGAAPRKKYSAQYAWGQLHFWERHTIESPDCSLSHQRRGTVSLPNLRCCYAKLTLLPADKLKGKKRRASGVAVRRQLVRHIAEQPHKAWSTRWHFGFKNGGLYGSPWLDEVIDADGCSGTVDALLKRMRQQKMLYPDGAFVSIAELEAKEAQAQPLVADATAAECKTNSTNPKHISMSSSSSCGSGGEGDDVDSGASSAENRDGSNGAGAAAAAGNKSLKRQEQDTKGKRRSSRLSKKPAHDYADPPNL